MFVIISDKIASLRFVYVGSVYWKFGGAIMVIFVPFLLTIEKQCLQRWGFFDCSMIVNFNFFLIFN